MFRKCAPRLASLGRRSDDGRAGLRATVGLQVGRWRCSGPAWAWQRRSRVLISYCRRSRATIAKLPDALCRESWTLLVADSAHARDSGRFDFGITYRPES